MLQTNLYATVTSISSQFPAYAFHDYIVFITKLKQCILAMYFFLFHTNFQRSKKIMKEIKIVVYRDSPSEGFIKLFFHYSKCKIIKQGDYNKSLAEIHMKTACQHFN